MGTQSSPGKTWGSCRMGQIQATLEPVMYTRTEGGPAEPQMGERAVVTNQQPAAM